MRYDLVQAGDGTWTVLDTTTGGPAEIDGFVQVGLDLEDADDLVDLLNRLDAERKAAGEH